MRRWSIRFALSVVVTSLAAAPAQAAPLTIAYVDSVTGWEWAQVVDTINNSWLAVSTVCAQDGVTACTADIGGVGFAGWVWATSDQVRDLFVNSTSLTAADLADGQEFLVDSPWGPEFLSFFAPTLIEMDVVTSWIVLGVSSSLDAPDIVRAPQFEDRSFSGGDSASWNSYTSTDNSNPFIGVWLHRPSAVPEPGTLMLLGTGVATAARRFRRSRRSLA